jgi:leader peptidase (prepilin peptidase)/N-methyltransferase
VIPQHWILAGFVFAFGCCIGSFLNVVIYRLPREKSLVRPGSACPHCGKAIRFYDNIPLLSWLALGAKCRYCKAPISARYFVVELLTGSVFLGLYLAYFHLGARPGMQVPGGWYIFLIHLVLLAAFIAGSGIDLELWIIPLSVCWLVTAVGIIGSALVGFVVKPALVEAYALLPTASPRTGALALGAALGLGVSGILLKVGLLKRSYGSPTGAEEVEAQETGPPPDERQFNDRLEALREIGFLAPIVIGAVLASVLLTGGGPLAEPWARLLGHHVAAGLFGSLFGYFVGCAVVWATRVLGTLAFGKEAMGLGDVHLMGAAGAVVGPLMVVVAFFIAPFFGLGWALFQMISKKIRQIPYGPFLSLAVLTVMIFHDWIFSRFAFLVSPR